MREGNTMPLDSTIEAEYADGFIINETEQNDVSVFVSGKNTFYDVLNGQLTDTHGQMVRFSVFWRGARHDFDWTRLPANARPIRFRHMYRSWNPDGSQTIGCNGVTFGYQFTDADGRNVKEERELN